MIFSNHSLNHPTEVVCSQILFPCTSC